MVENIILAQPWEKDHGSFHINKEHAIVLSINNQLRKKWYDHSFHIKSFGGCHLNLKSNKEIEISKAQTALFLSKIESK